MTLQEAEKLIGKAFEEKLSSQRWADLGCGSGLFTKALANLLPPQSVVYAVDQRVQNIQSEHLSIQFIQADFEKEDLPIVQLNGILMANSLHFIKNKELLLAKLNQYLQEDASYIIIEYDTDRSNLWVPYPIPFSNLAMLFKGFGFPFAEKISERPSVYGRSHIYACLISK